LLPKVEIPGEEERKRGEKGRIRAIRVMEEDFKRGDGDENQG